MSEARTGFLARHGWTALVLAVVVAIVGGYVIGRLTGSGRKAAYTPAVTKAEKAGPAIKWWTCSMHPEVHKPGPGRCPKCGMDLVPVRETGERATSLRQLTVTPEARALMEIRTSAVERRFVSTEVRMVGKVTYDETHLAYITAWVGGRIDRLYVDYTGITVRKGDHMVYLYSPELLSAQEELLQALKAAGEVKESSLDLVRERTKATVTAVREKLRLLGLTEEQVAQIEKSGKASDHLTIYAPSGGVVIHKNAQEGMYVKTGTRIYTIADLNQVWVQLDAYESDLSWLRYGQEVTFETEAYPGETFKGRIAFIDPFLNPKTRTVKVRVNVPNKAGKLKPDMFVRAVARAEVALGGRVMDPALAGKWICPMHPEVVKDEAGECDVCGMPLARTESLGYVAAPAKDEDKPLVIPKTAPLVTGKRAVVYVELADREKPTFEGREIVLGPRAGAYYIVRRGLAEGERVVTQGNFKIDSALQIQAKPSMMTPEGGAEPAVHDHGEGPKAPAGGEVREAHRMPALFTASLARVRAAGKSALKAAGDRTAGAAEAFGDLEKALAAVEAEGLEGRAALVWKELAMLLGNDAYLGAHAETETDTEAAARGLREHLRRLAKHFPEPKKAEAPDASEAFAKQLRSVFGAYFAVQEALAGDDLGKAREAAAKLKAALGAVDMKALEGAAHEIWMKHAASLGKSVAKLAAAEEIEPARSGFALVSEELAAVAERFGPALGGPVYRLHCPMAFNNRGADWLQPDKPVRNPYFGAQMLSCGEVTAVLAGRPVEEEGGHEHE
jgi:Cu(I)/Ag(I) efflux system membrane fusion protein